MTNAESLCILRQLLQEGSLCDVVITAGDAEFKAHRVLLCCCSSFFRDFFCNTSTPSERLVCCFPEVSPEVMRILIESAYTDRVAVTQDNVLELLANAHLFGVQAVLRACWDHLERRLCARSCIGVWKLSLRYNNPGLGQKAFLHTLRHFEAASALSADFPRLSARELAGLIDRDELSVRQESAVFEAVVRWIEHDFAARSAHMPLLLSKVRLFLLPFEYLDATVRRNKAVRNCAACRAMLTSVLMPFFESSVERPLPCPRLPSEVLLAMDVSVRHRVTSGLQLYNVRSNRWLPVGCESVAPRSHFRSCVHLDGSVYCVGGLDDGGAVSSVFRLGLASRAWEEVGSMHTARCHLSAVALDGSIYALGGTDLHATFCAAERFQPDANQWTLLAPMRQARSHAAAAALRCKLYIFGGCNSSGTLSSAESYDPSADQWTLVASMETSRSCFGVVAHCDQIYVVGGTDGNHAVSSAAAFDPQRDRWRHLPSMLQRRRSVGVAVLEDRLYVVGGLGGLGQPLDHVERYDGRANQWETVGFLKEASSATFCFVTERHPDFSAHF